MKPSSRKSIAALLVVVAIAGLLFFNWQWMVDTVRARTFQPSQAVETIMKRSSFSPTGELYFLASRPSLDEASSFSKACGTHESGTATLGCYDGDRIYLFNVDNAELDGMEEVTAAHEMLHAAYDRLGSSERQRIDTLLEKEAQTLIKEESFKKRISVYEDLPEADYLNELHSVIGTEVADPGSELQAYYSRYFKDRQAVITMHDKYQSVFVELQDKAAKLAATMTTMATAINADTEQYNASVAQLQGDISEFNSRAGSTGGFATQQAFYQERQQLVNRASQLETMRSSINQQVARYNTMKAELDAMQIHIDTLNNSIDSNLTPAPRV